MSIHLSHEHLLKDYNVLKMQLNACSNKAVLQLPQFFPKGGGMWLPMRFSVIRCVKSSEKELV